MIKIVITVIIAIVVLFVVYAVCGLFPNGIGVEQFTIQSMTKVENDQCIGHSPDEYLEIPKHLKEQCNNVKFDIKDDHNIFSFRKIMKHNDGQLCLTGCLYPWEDRQSYLYRLLKNVSRVCRKLNLNWVLYYGALLGYYRNKELLPWDPDLDILMDKSQIEQLRKVRAVDRGGAPEGDVDVVYEDEYIKFYLRPKDQDDGIVSAIFIDKQSMLYCDVFTYSVSKDGKTVRVTKDPGADNKKYLSIPYHNFFPIQEVSMASGDRKEVIQVFVPNDIKYNIKERYSDYETVPYRLVNGEFILN